MSAENRVYGGRYEVKGRLASGGMAEVYVANDNLLGRSVAVKVLHPEYARDRSFIERFRREAQAAASLNDPHVVSIYDWGSDNGTYYIVMEYVQGKSLRALIDTEGPLTAERAVEIAADVCTALEFAHARGIVHRDIKPANIMITPSGQTKVTDFGIARAAADSGQTMTQTGTVIGTASYLSPEQAQGLPVDARSDIYSTGVVLFEMLTHDVPFKGDTPVSIAYKHVKEEAPPPSQLNPEVSVDLDAIVMKALSKNPENRYQTAEEMRGDLKRVLMGEQVEATPLLPPDTTVAVGPDEQTTAMPPLVARTDTRRKALAYALVGLVFLGVVILGIALLFSLFRQTPAELVEVPDVRGKTVVQAERILEAAGLSGRVDREEFNESLEDGRVISQDPEDGRKVPDGSAVALVVSRGAERIDVPDIRGKSEDDAAKQLEDAQLKVGSRTREFSEDVAEGEVLSQRPGPGARVERGSSVDLVISGGKEQVQVPNLKGVSVTRAREALLDSGLNAQVDEVCGGGSQEDGGVVVDQSPSAGTRVPKGADVKLTTNRAKPAPGVIGLTEDAARSRIDAAGLKTSVIYQDRQPGVTDRVVGQNPEGGSPICPGETVTINVESGSQATPTSSPAPGPSPTL